MADLQSALGMKYMYLSQIFSSLPTPLADSSRRLSTSTTLPTILMRELTITRRTECSMDTCYQLFQTTRHFARIAPVLGCDDGDDGNTRRKVMSTGNGSSNNGSRQRRMSKVDVLSRSRQVVLFLEEDLEREQRELEQLRRERGGGSALRE
ncbi:hypothetical protein VTK26DRAFT_6708 [Humicola hyalothermophila]